MVYTDITGAIAAGTTTMLDVAGQGINFVVSEPILLFSLGVSFAAYFVAKGRQILGR